MQIEKISAFVLSLIGKMRETIASPKGRSAISFFKISNGLTELEELANELQNLVNDRDQEAQQLADTIAARQAEIGIEDQRYRDHVTLQITMGEFDDPVLARYHAMYGQPSVPEEPKYNAPIRAEELFAG